MKTRRAVRSVCAVALAAMLAVPLASCASEPRGGVTRLPGPIPDGTSYTPAEDAPSAPSLDGELLDGTPVDGELLRADRPLLVQFMASWCTNCVEQQDVLADIADEYGDAVSIVQVSGDNDPAALASYLEEHDVDQPVITDPELLIWRSYAVTEPPMTALIDASGGLVRLWPQGADGEVIREQLEMIVELAG